MRRTLLIGAVVCAGIAHPVRAQTGGRSAANGRLDAKSCLECHGQAHLGTMSSADRRLLVTGAAPNDTEDAPRPGLTVDVATLSLSVHGGLRCVECHADITELPHPAELAPVACGACHDSQHDEFMSSIHGEAVRAGADSAPSCLSCHGTHEILPPAHRDSLMHPLNAIRVCGECHRQHVAPTSNGSDPSAVVTDYLESVHGRAVAGAGLAVSATCADCHGHHAVQASEHPESRTSRLRIPQTCGNCHLGVVDTYSASVHGRALAAGSQLAPVCTDCHTGHRFTRASTPESHLDIVTECGSCHDRSELAGDRRASFYRTYRASYHGQVTGLGSTRAARCSDCHGFHDIQPLDDPASRVSGANLVETCRSCHPKATTSFARFDPHADYLDGDRYPLLHGVWLYFVIVMSAAFGFFGLHSILWFIRSAIERTRHGSPPPVPPGTPSIRRFTRLNRVNHAIVIFTFFGLVLTGLPLLFAEQPWARPLVVLMGGVTMAGVWHRCFGVMLIINFILHFYGLIRAAHNYPASWRNWLFGPNTMLPRLKDFRDCAAMFRWFFRGGPKPHFGRWTYWEKFDYWAEIGGSFIIGGSGLMLWFPELFSRLVPGSAFNIAMIVHGYEALLALGFIFTIHFFNAHLRVEKFPVDDVIFTGSLPEEHFREERPEEYEQLVASGRLESMRVPPPRRRYRRLAIIVGVIAMAVGLGLVTLIVFAGIASLGQP